MQVAYERAPGGFKHINDVIPQEKLERIGREYKKIAGFDLQRVNDATERIEGELERLGARSPKAWLDGSSGV